MLSEINKTNSNILNFSYSEHLSSESQITLFQTPHPQDDKEFFNEEFKIGKGPIFILSGTSTSGKTSIMRSYTEKVQALSFTLDEFGPACSANAIKEKEPILYVQMAAALRTVDIAHAVFPEQRPNWKPGIDDVTLKAAEDALIEARNLKDSFLCPSPQEAEHLMMDEIIEASSQSQTVIFDIFDTNGFIDHMIQKKYYAPFKRGLAYCPFHLLEERIRLRNEKALSPEGSPEDWRSPLAPLMEFLQYYKPAEENDLVIDILDKDEVKAAFKKAFTAGVKVNAAIESDYSRIKNEILQSLGFTQDDIQKVKITPKFKDFNYIFRTALAKPEEIGEFIKSVF